MSLDFPSVVFQVVDSCNQARLHRSLLALELVVPFLHGLQLPFFEDELVTQGACLLLEDVVLLPQLPG